MKLKFKDNNTGIVHVFDASEVEIDMGKEEFEKKHTAPNLAIRGPYSRKINSLDFGVTSSWQKMGGHKCTDQSFTLPESCEKCLLRFPG